MARFGICCVAVLQGLLASSSAEAERRAVAAAAGIERALAESVVAQAAARESERKRQVQEKKLLDTVAALAKAREDRDFLKTLNDTLLANQKEFQVRPY